MCAMQAYNALRASAALTSPGACRCVSPEAGACGESGDLTFALDAGSLREYGLQWLGPMARSAHSGPEPCLNGSSRTRSGAVSASMARPTHSGP